MIKKLFAVIIMLGLALGLVAVLSGCGDLPRSAVVKVNGKVVTKEDLDKYINQSRQAAGDGNLPEPDSPEYERVKQQSAEVLAVMEVFSFEAEKMGITISEEEIDQQIDQYKQQTGGEEQFLEYLKKSNQTLEGFRDEVREQLTFQAVYKEAVKSTPDVTDQEAKQYYDANAAQFQKPETRKVRHILVKDEATANQVKARLANGEDFATIAKEVSQDPGSKDKGGDLGEVPTSESGFVPEFEQAMNQLAAGQVSAPVKSQFGYHIIRVDSISPAGQMTFDEVKDQLKMQLKLEKERVVFDSWLLDILGNYEIIYAEGYDPGENSQIPGKGKTQNEGQTAPAATSQ